MTKKMRWPVKWLMLFGLLLAAGHMKAASDWVVGESYYLYNTGIGQFIRGGNNYGTRASFGSEGQKVTVAEEEGREGLYRLLWEVKGNGIFIANQNTAYMDAAGGDNLWQLEKQPDGAWRIGIDPANATYGEAVFGRTYMGFISDYNVPGDCTVPYVHPTLTATFHSAPGLDWLFLTEAEYEEVKATVAEAYDTRKALLPYVRSARLMAGFAAEELTVYNNPAATKAELEAALVTLPQKMLSYAETQASEENPVDVSFLIAGAECGDAGYAGWTTKGSWGSNTTYFRKGDCGLIGRFYESWDGNVLADRDLSQTLTALPDGWYTLGADVNAVRQNSLDWRIEGVNLYAVVGDNEPVKASCPGVGNGVPAYKTVNFEAKGQPVRIGLECLGTNANWMSVDNFKLYYWGTDNPQKNELRTAVKECETLLARSEANTEEAKAAMQGACNEAKAALAASSTEVLQQAIAGLETARRAYLSASQPVAGYAYDVTYLVANADMGLRNEGWQTSQSGKGNFRVWGDDNVVSNEFTGLFYERWTNNPILSDCPAVYQTLTGLQSGIYEVRAAAFCRDGSGFSVRANNDKVAVTDGKMKYYTVRTLVTDGQLTIALYAEPGNTKDWSGLADVSLTYYGEDLEPLKAEVALRKQQLAEWAQSTQAPLVALKNYLMGEVQQMQPENEAAQGYYELISTLKTIQTDAESTLAAYARVANWKSKYDDIVRQSAETEALETFRFALEAAEAEASNAMSAEAMVTAAAGMTQAFCVYLPQGKATEGRFDLTVFLDNASFDATGDGWNETLGWGAGVVEKYQASFNAWQLLTGMPAGMYTLCAQAAYRTSANETAYEAYQNGTAEVLASLYAGTAQKKVKNIFDDSSDVSYYQTKDWMNDYQTPTGKYVPNSLNGANEYFKNGLYWNSLSFEQEEAGDLTIGLKAENVPGGNSAWTLFDNFRLYYGVENVELDENEAYAVAEEKWADVTSNRVIKAGRWATLWVPFDIPAAQLDAFEEVKQLSEVVWEDATARVRFADVKEQGIRAGQPYLVRTVRDWTMAAEKVLLQPVAFTPVTAEGAVMKCVEQPGDIQGMYYIANNSFYLADVTVDSKNYRAVIELPLSQEVKSVTFDFGETTAVEGVDAALDGATVDVYTLSGIKVKSGVPAARALDGLNKGVYIVNGTKVVK